MQRKQKKDKELSVSVTKMKPPRGRGCRSEGETLVTTRERKHVVCHREGEEEEIEIEPVRVWERKGEEIVVCVGVVPSGEETTKCVGVSPSVWVYHLLARKTKLRQCGYVVVPVWRGRRSHLGEKRKYRVWDFGRLDT